MKNKIHYNVSLDTSAVIINDGLDTKAVSLVFMDKELNRLDIYPLPLDIAEDLGYELIKLAHSFNKIES